MTTVRKLRTPQPGEPFVSRRELAEHMGVSLTTVDRWVGDGMPSSRWGRKIRRFKVSECIRWAEQRAAA